MTDSNEEYPDGGSFFYRFVRKIFYLLLFFLYRPKVYGSENIPENSAFIICSNRINCFDPTLIGVLVGKKRQIYYMAKEELFRIPVFNLIIRKLGAFPVKSKKADRQAIRHALDLLDEGKAIGVFPEVTRSKTGEMQRFLNGPSLISLESRAPVLPVSIKGPYKLFKPVKIIIGKPLFFNFDKNEKSYKREQIRKVSNDIIEELKKMLEES